MARMIRDCEECTNDEIDMLHYLLAKRGTHCLKNVLDMAEFKSRKIQQYFEQRVEEEGILYQLVAETLGQSMGSGFDRFKSSVYSKMIT